MAKKRKNKKLKAWFWEVIRYEVTGNVWFWSGYLAFFVCDKGFGLNLWWCTIISNLIGWSLNFMLERYWVFTRGKKDQITNVSTRYIVYTAINFVLTYFILDGLKMVGITPYIGQFISAGFFTFWNYFWYKSWVFKNKPVRVTARKARG
jgi:putative flippase GtrA